MPEESTSPRRQPDHAAADLYCLECGYNLRGLSGDPRRCPECGHLNPLIDLQMPAGLVSAQLRQMETPPALCAAAVVGVLTSIFLFWLVFGSSHSWNELTLPCCALPLLIIAPFLWISNARKFRDSCLNSPRWKQALWQYHLCAVPLAVVVMSLVLFGTVFPRAFRDSMQHALEAAQAPFLYSVPVVIAIGGYFVHRQIKRIIQPLQREVALRIVKKWLRAELKARGQENDR